MARLTAVVLLLVPFIGVPPQPPASPTRPETRREVGKVTRPAIMARAEGAKGSPPQRLHLSSRATPPTSRPPLPMPTDAPAPHMRPERAKKAPKVRMGRPANKRRNIIPAIVTAAQFADSLPWPWPAIVHCESLRDGSWRVTSSSTHRGLFQFARSSWRLVGGVGDPAAASFAEQYRRARRLLHMQGWRAWQCAAIVGVA